MTTSLLLRVSSTRSRQPAVILARPSREMPSTLILVDTTSSSSSLSRSNHEKKTELDMLSARHVVEDDDLTIRPSRRKPPPKIPKQHVITNTITSYLSKSDSPEEVVSVTINSSPEMSFMLHKPLRNRSSFEENAPEASQDIMDAHEFFKIIKNPQTKNYKDVLPFLITRRKKFFKKRLWVVRTTLKAMNGEWNTLDIPLSIHEEFSSFSSIACARFGAVPPVDVLIMLSAEIQTCARVNIDAVPMGRLVQIFDRMFEDCHLLLRSRTLAKVPPRSGVAAAKSAMERFLPLSGGVDYLIKFCRNTFSGREVRYQWADRGCFEDWVGWD
ncbi:hypothetical protein DEU56DRAFT_976854 [Suillus clintonianus]|uniref:uncharacterized protein n=1 Tax=Suillus clintonianus TaxID=1904413 RepID=UPI001B86A6F1|nr:uncharacterized protein DEU56DRAFT_976854 [Suillus clintonianus]KAG2154109.1 hypothetical protein DEU56DRAFT_976854 [Suillus clintonianus]